MGCGALLRPAEGISIERLIDERARAIVAEEKAADARAREESARQGQLLTLRRAVDRARADLSLKERPDPRAPLAPMARWVVGALMVVSLIAPGALVNLLPHVIFASLDWTPAAVICPTVCEGCSSSLHELYSSYTVNGDGQFTQMYFCRNPHFNVDTLHLTFSWVDNVSPQVVEPYRVSAALVYFVESLCWVFLFLPFAPFVWRGIRNRQRRTKDALRAAAAAALVRAEAELSAFEGPRAAGGEAPYR